MPFHIAVGDDTDRFEMIILIDQPGGKMQFRNGFEPYGRVIPESHLQDIEHGIVGRKVSLRKLYDLLSVPEGKNSREAVLVILMQFRRVGEYRC